MEKITTRHGSLPMFSDLAIHKLHGMELQTREPKLGEGLVPLFAAAAIFWLLMISIAIWLWR